MLPLSHNGSPVFFGSIMALPAGLVKAPDSGRRGKKDGALPLQCGEKRRMIGTSKQRGVRIAGLRGDCHGLDLT